MKKSVLFFICLLVSIFFIQAQDKDITVKIYHTTDIHGNFFPHDFINNVPEKGGLARVSAFMKQERSKNDNVLFLDGGDVLQGQPSVYYYNFVDTTSMHLCAEIMNYLDYDAGTMGNHDIEAGHSVYDRWLADCDFPVLGANIINVSTGKPYLPAYKVFEKEGIRIAVLGMITEAIPAWLPENLWSGLFFDGIVKTAKQWVPEIIEKEKPDIMIALIHSGVNGLELTGYNENEGMELAQSVPGLDMVLCGHDHSRYLEKVVNVAGDSVLIIDPASRGNLISDITVTVQKDGKKVVQKTVDAKLVDISTIEPDAEYMEHFSAAYRTTMDYVNEEIGEFTAPIDARLAFIGPSAFLDLLHTLQLQLTGADISFVAPLSQTAFIDSGKVYMRDMFNLYRYENLLYTMKLTGQEVINAMEYFYDLGTVQMKSPEDHLLRIRPNTNNERYRFVNPSFSFDTAAGIYYTVDVTKPAGEKITVVSLADGTPFDKNKVYHVAVNSYQGSGGGGILTEGAGIPKKELAGRIVYSTDKDLRFYLAELIKKAKVVNPQPLNQWKFIPEEWAAPAVERDYRLLFNP